MIRSVYLSLFLVWVAASVVLAQETGDPTIRNPVRVVANQVLTVTDGNASGEARLFVLQDWSKPLPAVKRAIVLIHGAHRDADVTRRDIVKLLDSGVAPKGETLVILPQFLTEPDVAKHKLPAQTLWWTADGWSAGSTAKGNAAISSYTVLDTILARLADKERFPALAQVVVAGHSAGGQTTQRYAIEGRGDAPLVARGVHVRYVVANPSSYAYFSADRPVAPDAASCPQYNNWKYGMLHLNAYAQKADPAAMEATYVSRDVVYLLGLADTDPKHRDIDRGCSAETQGLTRLARGEAYTKYMATRHPGLTHPVWFIPKVAHNGGKMFGSACGQLALFDKPGCKNP
ncbi:MAG TPA: alpha/beta hydrolase [bacterium]